MKKYAATWVHAANDKAFVKMRKEKNGKEGIIISTGIILCLFKTYLDTGTFLISWFGSKTRSLNLDPLTDILSFATIKDEYVWQLYTDIIEKLQSLTRLHNKK